MVGPESTSREGLALNRPNFLVLGAAKAGTTSLCHYLAQHPDVFIPEVKEPIFFDAEYERGLDYYWKKYFSRWSGQPAVGEGRVFNLYLPFVPPRIRESIPDARLIAVLRNPVERAYSHWWHRFSYRDENLPFHEAIRENLSRIARGILFEGGNGARLWRDGLVHPHAMATTHRVYLDAGLYARQIRRYLDLFPASQLKVMFYEDLVSDPRSFVRNVWSFLEVSNGPELADTEPLNAARTTRRSLLESLLGKVFGGRDLLGLAPGPLQGPLRWLFREKPMVRPPLDPVVRQTLVEYYREPNRELERLVGRDLSSWSEPGIQRTKTAKKP